MVRSPLDLDLRADRVPRPGSVQISAVVPIFDECECLPELYARLSAVFSDLGVEFELLFVDDGSRDATPEMLARLAEADPHVVVVRLSRNFGHQAAVAAGLNRARGEAVVVLDGDLQDPPEVIPELIERWREGIDVVYAVRTKRKEPRWKRLGYWLFYRAMNRLADRDFPVDAGDFCLMDRRVVLALNALPERQRFMRGLRAFVGFRQAGVRYERDARQAGRPKYTFRKLVSLAWQGLIGFSSFPIRCLGWTAAATSLLALGSLGTLGVTSLARQEAPAAWAIVLVAVLVLGAIQLGAMALLGAYLLQIFAEVKRRPTYIVDEVRTESATAAREPTPRVLQRA